MEDRAELIKLASQCHLRILHDEQPFTEFWTRARRQRLEGGAMLIAAHREGHVLHLKICRADKRNALSRAVIGALSQTLASHRDDVTLKLLVLTGEGTRAFASGGDLAELDEVRSPSAAVEMAESFASALDALRNFPTPTIAAVNGDALGGGAELAMACDLRVAAAHARIGFLQGKLNISTAWGGGVDLLRTVGPGRALRLLGQADILNASSALELGLIDAVARDGQEFESAINDFCEGYLARTARVLRSFKALTGAYRRGVEQLQLRRIETKHFAENWVHHDHWAAVEASGGRAGRA